MIFNSALGHHLSIPRKISILKKIPHFITKGHVPEFYDRIPYIISNNSYHPSTYIYDWEKGMDLVKNTEVNGYEFLGWYDHPDFDGEKIERLEKGIHHNIVLYGKFVRNKQKNS
ncbi:MAG: hypothetical protein V8Q77_05895 [Bacilli bacterium]